MQIPLLTLRYHVIESRCLISAGGDEQPIVDQPHEDLSGDQ